jgi:hypothetical protein
MAKGKDKPSKQTKKPKSDKPKGAGSAYKQDKASGKQGLDHGPSFWRASLTPADMGVGIGQAARNC